MESDIRRAQLIIDEARSALVRVEQSIASQETALVGNPLISLLGLAKAFNKIVFLGG